MSEDNETLAIDPTDGHQEQESEVELVDLLTESVEPEDTAEDEFFDIDGEQLSKREIKELKEKKDSFQSDYTKKTMALAEERKAFESTKQETEQLAAYRREALSRIDQSVVALNDEIEQLEAINWDQVRAEMPDQFADLYAAASVKFAGLKQDIHKRETTSQQLQQQRDHEELMELAKAIPELKDPSKAREIAKAMSDYSRKYGFEITDSRSGKLVYEAMKDADDAKKYRDLVAKAKTKSRPNSESNAPEPVAQIKATAARSNGLSDDLPMDEWLKRREAELKRNNRRQLRNNPQSR